MPNSSLPVVGKRIKFLMVGWIDPRKGHLDVIRALNALWASKIDVSLTMVGRINANTEEIMSELYSHPELDNRLTFLGQTSDEELVELYQSSDALIAASLDEGFCLPLIEAATFSLPIIA